MINIKEKLLDLINAPSKSNLFILSKAFQFAIPFNKPHDFQIVRADENSVTTFAKYKRVNFNHIKGIHACALATIGEFSAGTCLIKKFGMEKYRFILKTLNAEYHYQGKMDVYSTTTISDEQVNKVKEELNKDDKSLITLISEIENKKGERVATITTTWQLKEWSKTKVKV